MSEKLKPCPFCGSDDVTVRWFFHNDTYHVLCNQTLCHSKDPDGLNKQEAIEAWNRSAKND